MVQAADDLGDGLDPPSLVRLDQQRAGQPVRVAPGVPVVDAAAREAHPAKIVPLQARRENPPVDLVADSLADQRRDAVKLLAQQVIGPGQALARLGGEQIHDRLGGIGQSGARPSGADVGGHAPERLLADGPDAIDDVVEEAALALDALRDDQIGQGVPAGEVLVLVAAAVAVAGVFEKERRRQVRPLVAEILLAIGDQVLAHRLGQALPRAVRSLHFGHGCHCSRGTRTFSIFSCGYSSRSLNRVFLRYSSFPEEPPRRVVGWGLPHRSYRWGKPHPDMLLHLSSHEPPVRHVSADHRDVSVACRGRAMTSTTETPDRSLPIRTRSRADDQRETIRGQAGCLGSSNRESPIASQYLRAPSVESVTGWAGEFVCRIT